jgi:hypothetical protein
MGIWRLKGIRKIVETGICRLCREEEELSLILRCEGTKTWGEEILDKRFWNIDPEIGIRKIPGCSGGSWLKLMVGLKHKII